MIIKFALLNAVFLMAEEIKEESKDKKSIDMLSTTGSVINLQTVCFTLLFFSFVTAAGYFLYKKNNSKISVEVHDLEIFGKEITNKIEELKVANMEDFMKNMPEKKLSQEITETLNESRTKNLFNISFFKKVYAAEVDIDEKFQMCMKLIELNELEMKNCQFFSKKNLELENVIKNAFFNTNFQFEVIKVNLEQLIKQIDEKDKLYIESIKAIDTINSIVNEIMPEIEKLKESPSITIRTYIKILKEIYLKMQCVQLQLTSNIDWKFDAKEVFYITNARYQAIKAHLEFLIEKLDKKDELYINSRNAIDSINSIISAVTPEIQKLTELPSVTIKRYLEGLKDVKINMQDIQLKLESSMKIRKNIVNGLCDIYDRLKATKTYLISLMKHLNKNEKLYINSHDAIVSVNKMLIELESEMSKNHKISFFQLLKFKFSDLFNW